jgi:ATP-binding cassette subfamily G (WHITE) protein 2 (SNQ2)
MRFDVYMSGCSSGYVQQMDTHLAQTTVREALLFSAKLRQPPSVPLKEKEA